MAVDELTEESGQPALSKAQIGARRVQLYAIAAVVVIIDQVTKQIALNTLADGPIEGPFGTSLRLIFNRAAAFSLGEGFGPVFGILAILVSIAMYWIVRGVERRLVVSGLGLVAGGAIGNVIDRAFRQGGDGFLGGAVVDFLQAAPWYPIFNVADIAVVGGGLMVAILSPRD